jgi:hypothetical protein
LKVGSLNKACERVIAVFPDMDRSPVHKLNSQGPGVADCNTWLAFE